MITVAVLLQFSGKKVSSLYRTYHLFEQWLYSLVVSARQSLLTISHVKFIAFRVLHFVAAKSKFMNRWGRLDDSSLWMKPICLWARTRRNQREHIHTHTHTYRRFRVSFKCLGEQQSPHSTTAVFKWLEGAKVQITRSRARETHRNDRGLHYTVHLSFAETDPLEVCPRHVN